MNFKKYLKIEKNGGIDKTECMNGCRKKTFFGKTPVHTYFLFTLILSIIYKCLLDLIFNLH